MTSKSAIALLGAVLAVVPLAPVGASVILQAQGSGPLLLIPRGQSILHETIDLSVTTTSGFPLDQLFISDSIDTSAPDPEASLFDAYYWLRLGGVDQLTGSFAFTSGSYTSATHEVFTGTFTVTGSGGAYAGYVGGGTFAGYNDWSDAMNAVSTMTFNGVLEVPEPPALALLPLGVVIAVTRRSGRRSARRTRV